MKTIILLAIFHEYQFPKIGRSAELEKPLDYLRLKLGAQIVMEEWADKFGQSVAAKWAAGLGLPWANVGIPDEPQFRTILGKVRYPEQDGTLPWDPHGPPIGEYGPFENQEARENWMATRVEVEMKGYQTGLIIMGLAHMHSLFAKLRSLGFKVIGYPRL